MNRQLFQENSALVMQRPLKATVGIQAYNHHLSKECVRSQACLMHVCSRIVNRRNREISINQRVILKMVLMLFLHVNSEWSDEIVTPTGRQCPATRLQTSYRSRHKERTC